MIEICRLKNVVIFLQTVLSFMLSRKITINFYFKKSLTILLFAENKT